MLPDLLCTKVLKFCTINVFVSQVVVVNLFILYELVRTPCNACMDDGVCSHKD